MGKLTWVHILTLFVGFIYDTDKVNGSTVNYEGFCVMPCRYQSKTYQSALDSTSPARWTVGSDDPSILAFRNNGTHISNQCMWRSGPFFVYRIERDGNTTHAWYYCSKHIPNDDNGDVITVYGNPMKQFPNYPTMCDVCTGNMKLLSVFKDETAECEKVILPDKDCNIPSVCPVTQDGQNRCHCEGKKLGDGLCCK